MLGSIRGFTFSHDNRQGVECKWGQVMFEDSVYKLGVEHANSDIGGIGIRMDVTSCSRVESPKEVPA